MKTISRKIFPGARKLDPLEMNNLHFKTLGNSSPRKQKAD